ncbi:MAG: CHRD domain-containing protein, partial [Gaiellaceae bacterium]
YALAGSTPERNIRETLSGYEEVPAVSTVATGRFTAHVRNDQIEFTLSYRGLEGDVLFAHIHFGQRSVNGGVVAFLCGGGGKPACPPAPATVSGTITASDVGAGAAAQGIAPGEFAEFLRAIRAGVTYANVHSSKFPGGEIRAQLLDDRKGRDDDDDEDDD